MPLDRRRTTLSEPQWTPPSELFSLVELSTSEGLEAASLCLQSACYTSANANSILNSAATFLLTLESCVFPLLLSSDVALNQQFLDSFSITFPTNAKDFMESTVRKLLDHLGLFYLSLPPDQDDSNTSQLHFRLHKTEPALIILSKSTYDSGVSPEPRSPTSPSLGEDEDIPFLKKHRKKKSRGASVVVDDSAFQDIGERRPRGVEEMALLEQKLLEERKETLAIYITSLLHPDMQKHAQKLLMVKLAPSSQTNLRQKNSSASKDESSPAPSQPQPRAESLPSNPVQTIQFLEEDVKDFGSWKILLSGASMKHLRQFRRADRHMFEIVKKKIQELSIGFFSKSNQKRLIGSDNEVPIYEAKMTGDTRLVYTIDCIPDTGGERVTQAIKMFGVYTHAQINSRLWAAVAHWSSKRGSEYRRRCIARGESKENKGYAFPMSWPPMQETYEAPDIEAITNVELSLELHALLTHEKFIPLTQSVLDSIIADEESTHPFSVSHREYEIIHHPSSCFVVGRSGTGKTTTMLFKMLGIERTSRKLGGTKVRQVFVTQSRVLAERVEEYFNNMIQSCTAESQTAEELEWRAAKRKEIEKNLMELDEEDDSSSNLPSRLSELEDKHFPLFLTFDKLCKLLEADFTGNIGRERDASASTRIGKRFRLADTPDVDFTLEDAQTVFIRKAESTSARNPKVLYEEFRAKYWPHFPQTSTKGLDPALVWNEFLGVIRGSELSLDDPSGALDRESYEGLSSRTQATFSRHRSRLYDVFEVYMKLKSERQEKDSADRTHALLRYLDGGSPPVAFDYIYVDEVQDNLLIDARLLRSLCRNPHGLFWAGDTAQQITSTAFRFSDLKAFLHRVEEADPAVQAQKRIAIHPKSFTLAINYRSHGGIINAAHSVVQLLTDLWPDSIDLLGREQGLVDGPKPVFFAGWDGESAHYEQFLFGEVNHRIEFGAQQCILVRNDAARERLRQQIGDVGVIMTLYESKGLEFSDVLLYSFFDDSPIKNEWRVVLNAIQENQRSGVSVPAFNELRHVGVCSELKFLYVGMTRARNNLWIWDTSPWAEPMKQFWESRGQIEVKRPGDHVPRLAVTSTVEEWEKMGRILFGRGNYQQAVLCFDRAEIPLLRDISRGYYLRKLARLLEEGTSQRKVAFFDAAECFSKCAVGEHDQSQKCYIRAAECYADSGKDREASDAFCKAEEFTKGAQHARKAADFDRAAEIIQNHPVTEEVEMAITGVCRVYFLRQKAFKKARLLCESDETFLEYFDTLGFDKSPILIELGRYEEAADVQLRGGERISAIKLYLKANSDSSKSKARTTLLEEWWRVLPCNAVRANSASTIKELSQLSDQMNSGLAGWEEEVAIFQSIVKNDVTKLLGLSQRLLDGENVPAGLRGLLHGLRGSQNIATLDITQMHFHLNRLQALGSRLRNIFTMFAYDFAYSTNTQKLLGYRISNDGTLQEAILLPSSTLNQRLTTNIASRAIIRTTPKGESVISIEEAGRLGREFLEEEFQKIIEGHSISAQNARAFQPICIMNITGNCQWPDCKYLHVSSNAMKEAVNQRFSLFLHQIVVINNLDYIPRGKKLQLRRIWISRLLDVLYPQINTAGKLGDIHIPSSLLQELMLHYGLSVLREWIRDAFYALNPSYTNQMLELFLTASAVDHYGVPQYFPRALRSISRRMLSDAYRTDNEGEKHPLAEDLYNGLLVHVGGAMESGVGYICHMVLTKTPLDIHLLVCILETTATRLLAGLKPNLHGLVIPTSWLFALAQYQTWPSIGIFAFLSHLLKPLMGLVKDIDSGCDYLSIEGRPVREARPIKRIMIIRRIFRCLVLAGCNTESNVVRNTMIGTSIAGLKAEDSSASFLPANYMKAETWDDLAWAATQSSLTDPVVQLLNMGNPEPLAALGEARQYSFRSIPHLLSKYKASPLVAVTPKSKLRPTAKEFVPHSMLPVDKKLEGQVEGDSRTSDGDLTTQQRLPTKLLNESNLEEGLPVSHLDAARKILLVYRQFHRRRLSLSKPNPLDRWLNECRIVNETLCFSKSYRAYFIGPLPHLLVCMDAFRMHMEKQKILASKSTQTVHHSSIEDALGRLDKVMLSNQHFLRNYEELKPSSLLHRAQNIERLCRRVSEMCKRVESYCRESSDLVEHFELAYKGIIQQPRKKIVLAQPKPSLNTSDLLEF